MRSDFQRVIKSVCVFIAGHRDFRPGGFQVQLRQHDRVPDRRRRGRGCARDFARHGALPAGGAQHFKQITYHPGEPRPTR